jgi:hypothetical protein
MNCLASEMLHHLGYYHYARVVDVPWPLYPGFAEDCKKKQTTKML